MADLPVLTLYTRTGCHLCEQAQDHLARLAFRVETLDVDARPEWRQRHGDDVPVLTLGDRVLARGVLSPARLSAIKIQLIRAAAAHTAPIPDLPGG